ncbi:PiT family inorganic phosphate transporter [Sphingomonas sp. BE138]|uniref:inorganic phosphate transporter n=1 Tax=Sphingomonas sp. BE138 TaxID=2817845 RepID=UPI00285A060E|nr:inorganic phosphate transporter [Sphingomonas sp. BE138]MDR6789504.1 PiT family inorganic phosphate transporter [Sphingomonas sp. BE138]
MASNVLATSPSPPVAARRSFDGPVHPGARAAFIAVVLGGFAYAGISVLIDTQQVGEQLALGVFAFLGLALLIALGFEFVNGFHDTANAVATVIYTNALPAHVAVIWSGFFNFLGVMASSGAVAYSIITLLPVDLILNVGSGAGFAMIFALLFAAVLWNLATWYVGLPNSSSHTLIGSVLGVGLANQLLTGGAGGTSGVDWSQATKVLTGLWMAPLIGFGAAALLLLVIRHLSRNPQLMQPPEGDAPPPHGIRALLIFTCTAVSFSHGSNDGQKGMGLIMLILIGCAPTAYALNRTLPASDMPAFMRSAAAAETVLVRHGAAPVALPQARAALKTALSARHPVTPAAYGATVAVSRDLTQRVAGYGALSNVPAQAAPNIRNDMYLVMDAARMIAAAPENRMQKADIATLVDYQKRLESGTRYIPLWVKVAVALALGLGTMVGWKRIVVTVGEKIGKQHMTYGMGASAELVAAGTILAADRFGLPVSTTHILSSGVAGASVASGHGLQRRTLLQLAAAWLMTLPVAMLLAGLLYWLLLSLVRAEGL